ncbi:uncharacterized protein LOC108220038 isoform X2 [Daucus carota subsp. sativus]|uniref:uncharacterized protein LOC108220038 isoform X2 n=1 Tax=Daucus carota subsp. sativus TaxID=79200 RepID=UPI0030827543
MDRYRKVQNPKAESAITENEIRITSKGLVRNYISYATSLLQEGNGNEIVLKAMGQAINKTVSITEIIKRRMPQLHQDTVISSVSIVDVWEPIEEGLLPVETSRNVSVISITLSTKELNKNSPGYQAPLNAEQAKQQPQSRPQRNYHQQQQGPTNNYQQQRPLHNHQRQPVKPQNNYQQQQPSRTHNNQQHQPIRSQNNYQQEQSRTENNYDQQQPSVARHARQNYNVANEDSYGRVRGRARGRGRGRGWSRGGYGSYEGNYRGNYQGNYQENYQETGNFRNRGQGGGRDGGYNRDYQDARGRGGGRGRGGYGRGRGRGRMGNYARDDINQE